MILKIRIAALPFLQRPGQWKGLEMTTGKEPHHSAAHPASETQETRLRRSGCMLRLYFLKVGTRKFNGVSMPMRSNCCLMRSACL